jgi:hypothetical protein
MMVSVSGFEELDDYERARAWRPSPALQLRTSSPTIDEKFIRMSAELVNASDEEVEVIAFPAYLALQPLGSVLRAKPRNLPPPVPPRPVRFVMAPRAAIPFSTALPLEDFEPASGQRVEIAWTFTYWNDPKPGGTFFVTLP